MAARLLAELGAEVIKVEPPGGDSWRKWLMEYEILADGSTRRDWAKELGIYVPPDETLEKAKGRARQRLSSPERWEAKQLIAAGVLPPEDAPGFDEELGILPSDEQEQVLAADIK